MDESVIAEILGIPSVDEVKVLATNEGLRVVDVLAPLWRPETNEVFQGVYVWKDGICVYLVSLNVDGERSSRVESTYGLRNTRGLRDLPPVVCLHMAKMS